MDFDYTTEQLGFREEAERFLNAHSPISVMRRLIDDPDELYARDLWTRIAAQGWLGITVPEAYGGLGLGHVELAAIGEAIGGALAPVPFGSTVYLLAEAVMNSGTADQKAEILPRIVAGEVIGCAALFEGYGELPDSPDVMVRQGRVFGVKSPVSDGLIADMAVLWARSEGGEGRLYLLKLNDPGVKRERLEPIDGSQNVAALHFDGAPVQPLGDDGRSAVEVLMARAAILQAAEQVGAASRCLAFVAEHVKERQAFGGPIGRMQAIKHKLADRYTDNELSRSHLYHGLWALDEAPNMLVQTAAAARLSASEAFWQMAKEGVHLHGAMGFTWEHDAHLFYRRAHYLTLALGSPRWWRDRLFEALEREAA